MNVALMTLVELYAELETQAGIHERAAIARKAVAEEIRRRDIAARAQIRAATMNTLEKEALRRVLDQ